MSDTKKWAKVVVPFRNEGKGIYAIGRHFATGEHNVEVTDKQIEELKARAPMGIAVVVLPDGHEEARPAPQAEGPTAAQVEQGFKDLQRQREAFDNERERFNALKSGATPPIPTPLSEPQGGLIPDPAETVAESAPSTPHKDEPKKKRF